MSQDVIILWYRNDLRIHDHQPLYKALKVNAQIIPIYCLDPRQFSQTHFGFPKTGVFRAKFLLESIIDLGKNLQKLGSNLVIFQDKPEIVIPRVAQKLSATSVFFHHEVTTEEVKVERFVYQALKQIGVKLKSFWGHTLYHPDDLPFEIQELPELFTNFRKDVENNSTVNPTFSIPKKLPSLPKIDVGILPKLSDLNLEISAPYARGVLEFKGGETAGLERVKNYFWQKDCLKIYKETRNGMLGANYSSKLLGINWQMGAEWFESLLIDYDVCSNWGNWNYTAGVGNDGRGFRYFNIPKQAKDYDPEGKYVKYWLPELRKVPAAKVHEPWKLLPVEQNRFGVKIGVDYPQPIVNLSQSVKKNEKIYNSGLQMTGGKRKARSKL